MREVLKHSFDSTYVLYMFQFKPGEVKRLKTIFILPAPSVRLADKDLTPLANCPNLRYLQCARFAPKKRFEELKALRPDIECLWFNHYEIASG